MKTIIANWKMNPATLKEALKLTHELSRKPRLSTVEVVVCPPFPYIEAISGHWPSFKTGAQDVFWETEGAYTGEVSPTMLKSMGVRRVLVGHSERRMFLGETDEMVNKKVRATLRTGLRVVLCVGEPKHVRREGIEAARAYVRAQLHSALKTLFPRSVTRRSLTIAYEPIWALSTSKNPRVDTPDDAAEMIQFIKHIVSKTLYKFTPEVLYGGSVNASNAANFLERPEIDGALVGGASLRAGEFQKIIDIAVRLGK